MSTNRLIAGRFGLGERIGQGSMGEVFRGLDTQSGALVAIKALKQSLAHLDNVRIAAWADRLVVDVCLEVGARSMVKGLRGGTDFAYELPMAHMNRHLTGVETLFLSSAPDLQHVSSSLIKEVVRYGGDVSGLVPDVVLSALEDRLR